MFSDVLGMSAGKANGILRKKLLFKLAGQCGLSVCFRCGKNISSETEFSIEHKTPWLRSADPERLFFDTGNIAFSHLSCNARARRPAATTRAESGFFGVRFDPGQRHTNKPWAAKVRADGRLKTIGRYGSAREAALAYDREVKRLSIERTLNFPG